MAFSMRASLYSPILQDGGDDNEKDFPWLMARGPLSVRWKRLLAILVTTLLASVTLNVLLIYRQPFSSWELLDEIPSKYAHLRRNIPTEITAHTVYDSLNRSIQDAAWDDEDVKPWNHFVALDEDYTISQGLLHSQRWPWDVSKGVYILTGAHELHCVRVLRVLVNENQDGVPLVEQRWKYEHLMHCLNVLRESVVCHADDTPLYIGQLHKQVHSNDPKAGIGDIKMCRDWKALIRWSKARSACYQPIHWGEEGFDELERYKFCPDGARPWEKV